MFFMPNNHPQKDVMYALFLTVRSPMKSVSGGMFFRLLAFTKDSDRFTNDLEIYFFCSVISILFVWHFIVCLISDL